MSHVDVGDELDDLFEPDFDEAKFRRAAAAYVKYLIRARWRCDPDFLTPEELQRWKLDDISQDQVTPARLLALAAKQLAHLHREYLPCCGSGGVPATTDTASGRLVMALAFLLEPEGGGPDHNAALLEASKALRTGATVDWPAIAKWDDLPRIRDDLDQLPETPTQDSPAKDMLSDGWHNAPPPPGNRCIFRLEGVHKLSELGQWTQVSRSTLRTRNKRGHVWIQKCGGQAFECWFASEAARDVARERMLTAESARKT
jgi:hypothetical protein